MKIGTSVSQIRLDIHRKFSRVTARDCEGEVVWRRRVEHGNPPRMRAELGRRRRRKRTFRSELGQPDDAMVVARR